MSLHSLRVFHAPAVVSVFCPFSRAIPLFKSFENSIQCDCDRSVCVFGMSNGQQPTRNLQRKRMPANVWLEWFLSSMGNMIWQSLYYCAALLWIGSDFTVREPNKSWTGCMDMRYNWKLHWWIDLCCLCGSFAKWALFGERRGQRNVGRWEQTSETEDWKTSTNTERDAENSERERGRAQKLRNR